MKPITLLGAFLVLSGVFMLMLVPTPRSEIVRAAEDDTPLADLMLEAQGTLKKLRRSVRKEDKRDESLELTDQLLKVTLASRLLAPPMIEKVPEAEKAAFVTAYRKMMLDVARATLDLETAVLDGDLEKAQELYKKIADMEDPGHEKFTEGDG